MSIQGHFTVGTSGDLGLHLPDMLCAVPCSMYLDDHTRLAMNYIPQACLKDLSLVFKIFYIMGHIYKPRNFT